MLPRYAYKQEIAYSQPFFPLQIASRTYYKQMISFLYC